MISKLKSPETIVYDFRFKLEDYESRLINMMKHTVQYNKEKLHWLSQSLYSKQPVSKILEYRQRVKTLSLSLTHNVQKFFHELKTNHLKLNLKLQALNPEAVLERGYSISRFASDKRVITDSNDVKKNDKIEVLLYNGRLITRAEQINGYEKNVRSSFEIA